MNSFLQFKNSIFNTLYMIFCGFEECVPSHSFGPAIRNCYLIHFCLDGKGTYFVKDKEYNIKKGQGFLIYPNEVTFYKADEKDPWTYLWVAFSGSRAEEYLNLCGLDEDNLVFNSNNGDRLKKYVELMLEQKEVGVKTEFFIQGLLFQFISELILEECNMEQKYLESFKLDYNLDNLYIQKALEYVNLNYKNSITVNEIANYLNLNRSYLTHIFKKNLNMTPQEFLLKFKITKASELLHVTDYSICAISNILGYESESSFIKIFKKFTGVSPSKYRKDKLYNFNNIKF